MTASAVPATVQLGFWSSLLIVLTFAVFTACFVAIPLRAPLFRWSGLPAYVAYVTTHSQVLAHVARVAMLTFAPLFVVLLSSVYDLANEATRPFARLALLFGLAFAALTVAHYFVQLSAVRLSVARGETAGLEQVVQANPYSAVAAMNVAGWSLFLGLASLCVAPVFSGGGVPQVVRYAFLLNGVCCLLGGIGYALDVAALVFVTLNLGMGGAMLAAAGASCLLFRRLGAVV